MEIKSFSKVVSMFLLIDIIRAIDESNDTNTNSLDYESRSSTKLLSRKRRFLIFPDGSSVQLVFCEQNHGYLQLGDIVWFGITAALAWELPTDPNIYHHILKAEKGKLYGLDGNRRQDSKHLVYLDEDGKVLSVVPYHRRKFLVNPAMAKRSLDSIAETKTIKKLSRKKLHELQKSKSLLQDLEEVSADFHREGRKDLYAKLETLFEQFGWSGKECILRFLCESAQREKQGTFVQEIVGATFTFPKSDGPKESQRIYDKAHSAKGECIKLYPECEADLLFE